MDEKNTENFENEFYITHDVFRKALEYSFDGIWIIRKDGVILFANDANERFYNHKGSFFIGKTVKELLDKGILKKSAALDSVQNNKECTLRLTGDQRYVYITSVPICNNHGEVEIIISNTRDVTEIMRGEFSDDQVISAKYKKIEPLIIKLDDHQGEREIVISSHEGLKLYQMLKKVSSFSNNIMILGESGTGKEVASRLIHQFSPNSDKPFVGINCSAIPESLLESELFGYEARAFTGAQKCKPGIFELAGEGTLLLDEIADIPLSTQTKLLRVIQEKQFMRVGGTKLLPVRSRIVSATNKDIESLCNEGAFRWDLYYRLNVVTITMPPLRKRKEDIPHIISNSLNALNKQYDMAKIITPEALHRLMEYDWPGNIRELENTLARMYILSDTLLDIAHLPREIASPQATKAVSSGSLKSLVSGFEADVIRATLQACPSLREAAKQLEIDPVTLWRKMQRYKVASMVKPS